MNKLPREVLDAPTVAVFKARLDKGTNHLIWCDMSLPIMGELELDDLLGPAP